MEKIKVKRGMKLLVNPRVKTHPEEFKHVRCGWVSIFSDYAGKTVTVDYPREDGYFTIKEGSGRWVWSMELMVPNGCEYISPLL